MDSSLYIYIMVYTLYKPNTYKMRIRILYLHSVTVHILITYKMNSAVITRSALVVSRQVYY